MDLFLNRGISSSYLLISRISSISSKFPVVLCNRCKITVHKKIEFLGMNTLSQITNFNILSHKCNKVHDSYIPYFKAEVLRYSSSVNSSSETKSDLPNKDCYTQSDIKKPSIFQRMKQMTKDYWHILIPVHLLTSLGWISICYLAAKNGVDIVGTLEYLHLGEKYIDKLRSSSAGHWAVAYALYKVFTPIRFTVTVGGTTMCIKCLKRLGYLKITQDSQLVQSIKCAKEHRSAYGKSNVSDKSNQTNS